MPKPKLMGILNATPDSFYDGNRYFSFESAIAHGIELYEQGADILDIGGESSRPGAPQVPAEEELRRVIPVIKYLSKHIPIPISIDTVKPEVARAAIEAGASFINDISGFSNPEMCNAAKKTDADICVMHMQGVPATMQNNPLYPEGIIAHLLQFFQERIKSLLQKGIKKEKIILDPGIGFGKTVADNFQIIQNLHLLKSIGYPVLVGFSRKSFMMKTLNKTRDQLLPATIAMNTVALMASVDYIRVHDVGPHRDVIDLMDHVCKW